MALINSILIFRKFSKIKVFTVTSFFESLVQKLGLALLD